jgi:hypothetical protein
MKFPKLPHRLHWRLCLIVSGVVGLFVAVLISVHWYYSSPFEDEDDKAYRKRVSDSAMSSNVTISRDNSSNELKVDVSYEGTHPILKITLPRQSWGVPGIALKQVTFSKGKEARTPPGVNNISENTTDETPANAWLLELLPPVLTNEKDVLPLIQSPWKELEPGNRTPRQCDDNKCFQIPLDDTVVTVQHGPPLDPDAFNKKAAETLKSTASAIGLLYKDNVATNAFKAALHNKGLTYLAGQGFPAADLESFLAKEANKNVLYVLTTSNSDSQPKLRQFDFDAEEVLYPSHKWGVVSYREAKRRSVTVVVTETTKPKYTLTIYTRQYANVVEAEEDIYKFQTATADGLAITDGKAFLDEWLITNAQRNAQSLDPFFLYPQLLSIRAASSKDGQLSTASEAKRQAIIRDLSPNNLRQWNTQAHAFRKLNAVKSGSYYPTYIYCNYVLCITELRRLSRENNQTATDDAIDYLIEHGVTLTNNLDSNGNFYRYFDNPDGGYDRSVGLIALYTLIHLVGEIREYERIATTSDTNNDSLLRSRSSQIKQISDGLDKLAWSYRRSRSNNTVRYSGDNGDGSINLLPGYFLATLVLYDREDQSELINGSEFAADMNLLLSVFQKDSKYSFALGPGYADAYRWMFWARVMERLKNYTTSAKGQNDDRAKAALAQLRKRFLETVVVASLSAQGRRDNKWTPKSGLNAKDNHDSEDIRDGLLMIALETARMEYLKDSSKSLDSQAGQASEKSK